MYIPALFIHSKHQFNIKKSPTSLDCFKRPPVICDLFLKVPLKVTYDSLDCILKKALGLKYQIKS